MQNSTSSRRDYSMKRSTSAVRMSTSQEDQDIVEASFWTVLCRRHRRTKTSWRHRSGPSCVKEVFSFQILQLPIIGSLKTKPKNKQKEKTKFFNYNSYCYGGHVAVVDRCVVTSTDRQQGKLCQMTDESKTGTDLTWLSRACMCWQTSSCRRSVAVMSSRSSRASTEQFSITAACPPLGCTDTLSLAAQLDCCNVLVTAASNTCALLSVAVKRRLQLSTCFSDLPYTDHKSAAACGYSWHATTQSGSTLQYSQPQTRTQC